MPISPPNPDDFTMSFGDHLEELRKRVLLALAAPIPLFIVAFFFSDTLIEWLVLPVFDVLAEQGLPLSMLALSPPEIIMTQLKLSIIAAVIVSAPWIIFQAWQFIAPGLYHHERRFVYFLIPGSAILTVAGLTLLYKLMLPIMLYVLVTFGTSIELDIEPPPLDPRVEAVLQTVETLGVRVAPPEEPEIGDAWILAPDMTMWVHVDGAEAGAAPETLRVVSFGSGHIEQKFRVLWAINFVLLLALGTAIAFQLPLVILLLGWLGIATPEWLRANRKYALIACAVLSAMLTPADATSMLIMLIPVYALYELGILLLVIAPPSAVAEGRVLRLRTLFDRAASARKKKRESVSVKPGGAEPRDGAPPAAEPDDDGAGDSDQAERKE